MTELPELTPQHFEILVVRELRKVGLERSGLRIHRRATLPEPERGYLLELKGVLSGTAGPRPALIACRRQQAPVGRAAVESLREHVKEAVGVAGVLFAAADYDPDTLTVAHEGNRALFRVTYGLCSFDTSVC